ncbi:MAG: hypothetical protein ACJ8D5_00045 [Sphingomicrobium sp.]
MKNKGDLVAAGWTRPEDYLAAMARRRTARRAREPKPPRTQPESPRMLLSTIPMLALLGALAVLAVAIMVAAFPGSQPQQRIRTAGHELGTAEKGWFEEAKKEFH